MDCLIPWFFILFSLWTKNGYLHFTIIKSNLISVSWTVNVKAKGLLVQAFSCSMVITNTKLPKFQLFNDRALSVCKFLLYLYIPTDTTCVIFLFLFLIFKSQKAFKIISYFFRRQLTWAKQINSHITCKFTICLIRLYYRTRQKKSVWIKMK